MDFHLERKLRLHTKPEYENLYKWAINEIDAHGQPIGQDQIPWYWSLYFTATSCVLSDSFEIEPVLQNEQTPPSISKTEQVIRVQLRPQRTATMGGLLSRETTFSMFGTDRTIKSFELHIHATDNPAKQDRCSAWGSVSYTSEIDLRDETTEDCIVFYLFVKPETFARYGAKIAHGLVDEITLLVESVSGFYSEWSPSISTKFVKVLCGGEEHKITLPTGLQFEPPRLGKVGEVALYINRRLEFGKGAEPETAEAVADVEAERAVPQTQPVVTVDPQMLQMLGSLRRAAWFVVFLLALIFIVTLSKGH